VGQNNYIHFVLLFVILCNYSSAQNNPIDSSKTVTEQIRSDTSVEKDINIPIESFKLFIESYYSRNNDLQFSTNFDFSKTLYAGSFNQDKLYLISLNNQEFLKQLSINFKQSQPTTWQKILGMVNTGAVAAMAGYHVYKYYVKEKKKF